MMIRQFTGTTIDEILPQIREELGDDALIISTRRVAKGGIGGFFGREMLEVTAAEGGEIAEANSEAAARPGDEHDGAPPAFSRHLQGKLDAAREAEEALALLDSFNLPIGPAEGGAPAAAPAAAYQRGTSAPAPRPFAAGDPERTQAIIEAAREAMRQAHAQSTATAAPEAPTATPEPPVTPSSRIQPPPWATAAPLTRASIADALPSMGATSATIAPQAAPQPPAAPPAAPRPAVTVAAPAWAEIGPDPRLADQPTGEIPPITPAMVEAHRAAAAAAAAPVAPVVTAAPPEEWAPTAMDPITIPDEASPARPLVMLTANEPRRAEDPALRALRQELVQAGVHERYLDPLLDGFHRTEMPFAAPGAAMRDVLRDYMAARMPVVRDWKGRGEGHMVVLVGQSGVGKTTTACKLAGRMTAAGMRVALIAGGPGPHHALEGHARRLGIDAILCEDAESLVQAREALRDRDLVIVDTAGRSHQDLAEIESLARLVGPAKPDEVHLVIPVTAALTDLGDVARRFRLTGMNRVTVTKLDETRFHGNLVNFPMRLGKPLGFLGDGTGVPGALAPADGAAVARLLLP